MSRAQSFSVIFASVMVIYAGGLSLTNVFVFVPYIVLLGVYFHVFKTAHYPHVNPEGKAVFITGCDTGFGHTLASRLAARGFVVFAGCLVPEGKDAKQLLDKGADGRMHLMQCDVTSDSSVEECFKNVEKKLGSNELWAVVNNAGIAMNSFTEWTDMDLYKRHLDVNVLGVVRTTKTFLPLLRKGGKNTRIVNVASTAGRVCLPGFSAYCMSKHAVRAFSDCLRREVVKFGIKVITIEPSLYKTNISSVDTQVEGATRQWQKASAEVRSTYGERFFNGYLKAVRQISGTARDNVDEVIAVLQHAVSCRDPDREYSPHWSTRLRISFLHMLPLRVEDWFMRKFNPVCRIEELCEKI